MNEIGKRILEDIIQERKRQERLKTEGRFKYTLADPEMSDFERVAAITEETGELAQATLEEHNTCSPSGNKHDKKAECVQVAACCWAWLEHIYKNEN